MDELEEAHIDYLERKEGILNNLKMLLENTQNEIVKKILKETIEFINEKEI